jgi:hypothetical protein
MGKNESLAKYLYLLYEYMCKNESLAKYRTYWTNICGRTKFWQNTVLTVRKYMEERKSGEISYLLYEYMWKNESLAKYRTYSTSI